jgi:NADH-quinone oxidoreductase subunit J
MTVAFYLSGSIALIATAIAVSRRNAVHALLYLVASLLAVAVVFYTLGAPFAAALEVIIYAGAIMVLFVFVILMLNPVEGLGDAEPALRRWTAWAGPAAFCAILAAELVWLFLLSPSGRSAHGEVVPAVVGVTLLGPYVLGVELASFLLLAGLIAAYHLGRRAAPEEIDPRE